AEGKALLLRRGEDPLELCSDARAISWDGREILVARGEQVLAFDAHGKRGETHQAGTGAVAALRLGESLVLASEDGSIELVPAADGTSAERTALDDVPDSTALRLLRGPRGTVIIGFTSGHIGIWDTQTGVQLDHVRLFGPVVQIGIAQNTLYAATETGEHVAWDLSAYFRDYCELLQDVWREVPVSWEGGRPIEKSPPEGHRCLARRASRP
ncbi:MAG: hypothetical protein JXR96_11850, partial [Deltaproteobacteria bacterium]|nr:hypothetical protein [Deltaproteobacteria bacterium]